MMNETNTWGGLSNHEIARRIMLAERAVWARPVGENPKSEILNPKLPPMTVTALQTGTLGITDRMRQVIVKLNKTPFTAGMIIEALPDIVKLRITAYLSRASGEGYLEKNKSTKPIQYRQIRDFSEPTIKRPRAPRFEKPTQDDTPSALPAPTSKAAAPAEVGYVPGFHPGTELQSLLRAELQRIETRANAIRVLLEVE